MPFNHDDRELLRTVAAHVDAVRHQCHRILAQELEVVARLDRLVAELIQLRQSQEAMVQVMLAMQADMAALAAAEDRETLLDYITVSLTSP